jgi:hypothetical protein
MTLENEMSDVVLLMISIAFVLVALLAAVTTLSAPLAARLIADGVIKGSCTAALVSVLLATLFSLGQHF